MLNYIKLSNMKKEIKFRAWDKSQKYMAYQGMPDLETLQSFIFHFGDKPLMQYTGLKDKNGIEVYEGDIVDGVLSNCYVAWCNTCCSYEIFIETGECLCCLGDYHWYEFIDDIKEMEVIGNIYENPELLNYIKLSNMKKEIKLPIGAREYFEEDCRCRVNPKHIVLNTDFEAVFDLMEKYARECMKDVFTKEQVIEMLLEERIGYDSDPYASIMRDGFRKDIEREYFKSE